MILYREEKNGRLRRPLSWIVRRSLEDFGHGQSDMIGSDHVFFFSRGGDHGPAREVVGFSKQPTGALMNGGDGGLFEARMLDSRNPEMMKEISFHFLTVHSLQMAAGHDS